MNFNDFTELVAEEVTDLMGEEYHYSTAKVMKNNNIVLTGLSVRKDDEAVAPTLYLEDFYEMYENGETIQDIVSDIVSCFKDSKRSGPPDVSFMDDFEKAREKLMYKTVNYSKNEAFLANVPHKRFLDLAIIFYLFVTGDEFGAGSITVTNEWMKIWGVDTDTLYEIAYKNTKDRFGFTLNSITEVLKDLIPFVSSDKDETDDTLYDTIEKTEDMPMYVLSNASRHFGASCILFNEVLNDFAKDISSDLFILPSSIHELIIIPDNGEDPKVLQRMVMEVNSTQVSAQDVLSDNIYRFSRNTHALEALYA